MNDYIKGSLKHYFENFELIMISRKTQIISYN